MVRNLHYRIFQNVLSPGSNPDTVRLGNKEVLGLGILGVSLGLCPQRDLGTEPVFTGSVVCTLGVCAEFLYLFDDI